MRWLLVAGWSDLHAKRITAGPFRAIIYKFKHCTCTPEFKVMRYFRLISAYRSTVRAFALSFSFILTYLIFITSSRFFSAIFAQELFKLLHTSQLLPNACLPHQLGHIFNSVSMCVVNCARNTRPRPSISQ